MPTAEAYDSSKYAVNAKDINASFQTDVNEIISKLKSPEKSIVDNSFISERSWKAEQDHKEF